MSKLKELRIVDNFYQTSSFFPMPTTLISTVSENGQTNLGAYSLCFPYYIAGKEYYAMVLECRDSSLRTIASEPPNPQHVTCIVLFSYCIGWFSDFFSIFPQCGHTSAFVLT